MNPLREKTEYVLTKRFFCILRLCPSGVIYGLCRGFAFLFYTLGFRRRRMTLQNMQLALPNLSAKKRRQMARASFDHFGQFMAESTMIMAGKIDHAKLLDMVDGTDISKLLTLEKSTDKGILLITGHLGNFELLAHYTGSQLTRTGHVVARKGTNQLVDDRIVTPLRESFGNNVIYKERALPHVARALKRGEHVGLLIDIKSNAKRGVPITFFGNETHAIKSSAYLQIKLNPIVVPITMARVKPKRYKFIIGDPIAWSDNGQPIEEQISELTQIHQTALEKLIRQHPEQWLWMHNRFQLMDARTRRRQKRKARRIAAREAQ